MIQKIFQDSSIQNETYTHIATPAWSVDDVFRTCTKNIQYKYKYSVQVTINHHMYSTVQYSYSTICTFTLQVLYCSSTVLLQYKYSPVQYCSTELVIYSTVQYRRNRNYISTVQVLLFAASQVQVLRYWLCGVRIEAQDR